MFTLTLIVSSSLKANDYELGLYELNRGSFKAALAQFEPLAMDGFSPAQYQLAIMYKEGYGVTKNLQKTVELLTLAANQNDSDAQFNLSLLYSEGEGVKKDLTKAFTLMQKSAKKGLASAQYNLAVIYYQGLGTHADKYEASKWYQKAAKQNFALAQFNLALMYFNGEGVEKSLKQSFIWNTIAAYNGYPDAATSRDMDAHKMPKAELIAAKAEADELYANLIKQAELRAKKKEKHSFY